MNAGHSFLRFLASPIIWLVSIFIGIAIYVLTNFDRFRKYLPKKDEINSQKYCPQCGAPNPITNDFCEKCGAKFNE